jgi:tetratricopeptide (TPR) repeat protein
VFLDATWRLAPDFWSIADVPRRIEAVALRQELPDERLLSRSASRQERSPDELHALWDDAKSQGDIRNAARVGVQLGELLFGKGDIALAEAVVREILSLVHAVNEPGLDAPAHGLLGRILFERDDLDEALREIAIAYERFRAAGTTRVPVSLQVVLALALWRVRTHDTTSLGFAAANRLEFLQLVRTADSLVGKIASAEEDRALSVWRNIGWTNAEAILAGSRLVRDAIGDTPTSRAGAAYALALGLRDNGRWSEAEPLFREALTLMDEGGAPIEDRDIVMKALAVGLADNGRNAEAEALLKAASDRSPVRSE